MTLVWRSGYTTTFADPDVQTYLTAVEEADGQALEYPVAYAINSFVLGCKADGIWSAIKASCILAGARTRLGALTPLVGAAPTSFNFVDGDYNRKTGLVGNGSTKYLNSNRANNADPQNNRHLSFFTQSGFSDSVPIGSSTFGTGPGQSYNMIQHLSSTTRFFSSTDANNFTSQTNSPYAGGVYGITRSSSTSFTIRFRQLSLSANHSTVTPHSNNQFVFCRNADGGPSNYSNARLAFYSIGESLDLALLDARVSALITAIGAAIP